MQRSKFHYVEKGDRNNRLLLLIHGYPEFWYSWRFQLKDLSNYYWVVAIDVKGYGDSDKPSSRQEYAVPVLVEELYDFLTAIGKFKKMLLYKLFSQTQWDKLVHNLNLFIHHKAQITIF